MSLTRRLGVLAIALTLMGCGGGGEKAPIETDHQTPEREPVPSNLQDIPSVNAFDPSIEQPEYAGSFEQANLTQQNGPHFAWAMFELLTAAYSVGRDMDLQKPDAFHRDYDPIDMRNMQCQAGSREVEQLEFEDHRVEVVTYEECLTDRGAVTGQLVLKSRLHGSRRPSDREAYFRQLAFHRGDEYTLIDGLVELNDNRQYTIMLTLVNSLLNEVYYTEDLFVEGVFPSGKIYHNDWGYVDVESGFTYGPEIKQIGKDRSVQELDINPMDDHLIALKLLFRGQDELQSRFLQHEFPLFPHRNRPPVLKWQRDHAREVPHVAVLDFSASEDPDLDYLSFEWEYLDGPTGCEPSDFDALVALDGYPDFGVVELYSYCPGEHRILASVQDGTVTESKVVSIMMGGAADSSSVGL